MIHFDTASLESKAEELEKEMNMPNFWDNPDKSTVIVTKMKKLQNKLEGYQKLEDELNNLIELNDLLLLESDENMAKDILSNTNRIEIDIGKLELEILLSGKYDKNNAILTLHPGAGGTESQDWAEMLYRMYSKWAINNGFKTKELDFLEGDGAGIKSVTFIVTRRK